MRGSGSALPTAVAIVRIIIQCCRKYMATLLAVSVSESNGKMIMWFRS